MKVLVIGYKGNMGQRYCHILRILGIDYAGCDVGDQEAWYLDKKSYTHYIIATPTPSHLTHLNELSLSNARVLCEKPLISYKNPASALDWLIQKVKVSDTKLYMVNNYAYAMKRAELNCVPMDLKTHYCYYNSGKDGFVWDCIQFFWLAKEDVLLRNDSPVWMAKINGIELTREDVDWGYWFMIKAFVNDEMEDQNLDELYILHKEVQRHHEKFEKYNKSKYWYPGKNYKREIPEESPSDDCQQDDGGSCN